jgi:hypothetical protein
VHSWHRPSCDVETLDAFHEKHRLNAEVRYHRYQVLHFDPRKPADRERDLVNEILKTSSKSCYLHKLPHSIKLTICQKVENIHKYYLQE